jgi:hypothetical protein
MINAYSEYIPYSDVHHPWTELYNEEEEMIDVEVLARIGCYQAGEKIAYVYSTSC